MDKLNERHRFYILYELHKLHDLYKSYKSHILYRFAFTLLLSMAALFVLHTPSFAGEAVWQQNHSVAFSGGTRTVNAVYVDLNNKTIRMESVLAKNQVGKTDDLKNIAALANTADTQAVAAINGTFFNSYTDMQPMGTIQTKGVFQHIVNTGSVLGFTGDNKVVVESMSTAVSGHINGYEEYPNNWSTYDGINHRHESAGSNVMLTPAFGKTTGKHNKTSIVVDKGTVTKICKGEAPIPPDGYTLVLGSAELIKRFHVGDHPDYKFECYKNDINNGGKKGALLDWSKVRTTVGAGPTLVKAGKILANGKLEGFKEDKINTNRGQRSFAGIKPGNIFIMGTVSNVTVKELAEIVRKLGITDGINLDGGASSGLYFKGKYITAPGRKLSNALVVTAVKEQPVRLTLNQKELFCQTDPYMVKSKNILMVPLADVFKAFDGKLLVDSKAKTLSITRYKKKYLFKAGSSAVKADGQDCQLEHPVEMRYNQFYAPLHSLVELLGGSMKLDNKIGIASITADSVTSSMLYDNANKAMAAGDEAKAVQLYIQASELDSAHAGANLKLAKYYAAQKDNPLAA